MTASATAAAALAPYAPPATTPSVPWRAASPVRAVSAHAVVAFDAGWELARADHGADLPDAPGMANSTPNGTAMPAWRPAAVPGTVAAALRTAGAWDGEQLLDLDGGAWWFRRRFARPEGLDGGTRAVLCFDGLATHARVWLNGVPVARATSMFAAHAVDVTALVDTTNELVVRCDPLRAALDARRGRPRWRTRLASHQQMRWERTTLLGRVPGWSPAAPVGPWRPVRLELRRLADVHDADVRVRVEGHDGVVDVALTLDVPAGAVRGAALVVGDVSGFLDVGRDAAGRTTVRGAVRLPGVERWWPHTHGAPVRHAARVDLAVVDPLGRTAPVALDLGRVGFRTVELRTGEDGNGFALAVNGVELFCRGACWVPPDPVRLHATAEVYDATVAAARDAGMNMLRVSGGTVYEDDAFYEACDAAGVLVWQDFMFANMDYPAADPDFRAAVDAEAAQQLGRLQARPCLAVLCGGSEVSQQAAMAGAPRALWAGDLFVERLAAHAARLRPDVPYVPSSPWGGALPFHAGVGVSHYYGVGAYRRPLEDARRAGVRFAAECLALSHVPSPAAVDALMGGHGAVGPHPRWKAGIPRDPGAAWDFEDVRDHYLALLFGADPVRLRGVDPERYLALSRAASGEVLAATLAEWRRPGSSCRGALVWTLRDVVPGAGWGLLDTAGVPKAAYYYVRRVLQPVALLLTDEGLNGVHAHVVNDGTAPLDARVEITLLRDGETAVGHGAAPVVVPGRSGLTVPLDGLFEGFVDTAWAYRFGPPAFDVLHARLVAPGGELLGEASHFPLGRPAEPRPDVGLEARAWRRGDAWALAVRTRAFAHAVTLECDGFVGDDDHFDLAPGDERVLALRPAPVARGTTRASAGPAGVVRALNARRAARISLA